ncbi:MAG: hypothetical protein J6L83_04030, partial [Clostridia bacterium]|nr:hypothetical protein [Clostridia bacterium]
MFGYIRTDVPEMRVRENEYYRAVYCGLCRSQGKCTGQCSRFTLNYDMVFLALLRIALEGKQVEIKRGRCIAHPFKKRAYVTHCEPLAYCAYAAAILTHGKVADDLVDEKGFKRFKASLIKPFTSHMRKKALKKYSELDERVSSGLKRLSEIEAEGLASVDVPADEFGEILADILSYGLEGTDEKIMRNIGRHVGRWIYIIDAADDLDEDIKKNRFNAFAKLYGGRIPDEERESVANSLRLELLAAEPAFDLIDYNELYDIEAIIGNI